MIELELLGVEPSNGKLSLNDPEGNRYSLAITDELLAALRRDVPEPAVEPKPITPREIQAMFRAGKSVDDVAQISALSASALLALEHPITAERRYTAHQARSYRQAHELGGLTIEELVMSRLVERGVTADGITWDAYREAGAPWTLSASYTIADETVTALWRINSKTQSVVALNDEAAWLTETAVPAPSSPWRAHNTPRVEPRNLARAQAADTARLLDIPRIEPRTSQGAPDAQYALDTPRDQASDGNTNQAADDIDIDSVLASLDSQRGKVQAMPDDDFFDEWEDSEDSTSISEQRAGRAEDNSDDLSDDASQGATLLAFPSPSHNTETSQEQQHLPGLSADTDGDEESQADTPEKVQPKKKRRDRPTMPSWDEIVFGYSKDEHE